MRVGILGPGLMNGKLGTIFARAGHEVVFSCVLQHGEFIFRRGDRDLEEGP